MYCNDKSSCKSCQELEHLLTEKEREITRLKFQVKKLKDALKAFENDVNTSENKKAYSKKNKNKSKSSKLKTYLSDDIFVNSSEKVNCTKEKDVEVKVDSVNLTSGSELAGNSDGSEYIYDEQYKMYYCTSTGYYYDTNSGLYYVPEKGAYYSYNYETNAYELFESAKTEKEPSLRKFVDQVKNLHLSDNYQLETSASTSPSEKVDSNDSNNDTCSSNLEKEDISAVKDWDLPPDSSMTIKDLVKEVVEQCSETSDYVYDEGTKTYFSPSTGYYYDPIKKLLYDPYSGIYYLYNEDKKSYDYFCQVDVSKITQNQESAKQEENLKKKHTKDRRKYWKKKQYVETSPKSPEEKVEQQTTNVGDDFSSPEEGELFSSESESDVNESKEESYSNSACPPCIRAIVLSPGKLKAGTLILIACTGAVLGRDKANTVYLPDISVSKVHAEITFARESWKYKIEDLGSQNGTFINEVRISEIKEKSETCYLSHGDVLALGTFKLSIHIHKGHETCDKCEPGQVLAELSSKESEKNKVVLQSKESKEKERRKELSRIKSKYGLKGIEYVSHGETKTSKISKYKDKAEMRRQTVGSECPYEKTESSSLETTVPESNVGYQMLKKLGWKEGEVLGASGTGISEPVPLRGWFSKAGLGSSELQVAAATPLPKDKRKVRWVKAQERYSQIS